MKKYIVAAFVFTICYGITNIYSQEKKPELLYSKQEISIVVDDLFGKQTYVSYPYFDPYYLPIYSYIRILPVNVNIPKLGLAYKYHFNTSALRAKIAYGSSNSKSESIRDSSKTESSVSSMQVNLGYEFNKTFEKVQVFYGIDVSMKISEVSSESSYIYQNETYTTENEQDYTAYGLSPLFGVKYFVTPKLSVSTEIKYTIETYEGSESSKYSGDNNKNTTNNSGTNTFFGPIGQISINFHF